MKTFKTIILLMLLSIVFAQAQVIVQGEKKPNTDFTKYKTFNWMDEDTQKSQLVEYTYQEFYPVTNKSVQNKKDAHTQPLQKNVVVYSYSYVIPSADSAINNTVMKAAKAELEGRGYKKNAVNPDLLVAYRIFDRSAKIKGYDAMPTVVNGNEVREPQDTVTYALKPGTVMVSLIDAKTSDVIWEGFASGVANESDIINDKVKIKEAINLIFKKYEWRGDKYSMK